jgi:hypothetical protein
MEIVESGALHTDLEQLILEEDALVLESVELVSLLLLVGVEEQLQLLTASSHIKL